MDKVKFAVIGYDHKRKRAEMTARVSTGFVNGGMGSLNYSTSVWNQNLKGGMTAITKNGSMNIMERIYTIK